MPKGLAGLVAGPAPAMTTLACWTAAAIGDRIGHAQDALLRGGKGDQDEIVLILAAAGIALGRQHADHRQRHVFDQHGGADRIGILAEQIIHDGLAEDADHGAVMFVLGVKSRPEATAQLRIDR